jgi:3-methylfumaryl-CoA hydratase
MELDITFLQTWVGKTETHYDRVTPVPIAALSATLDRDDPFPRPGDPLPPFWHRLYFLPVCKQSDVGSDGHPKLGGFLPPVPLPRRMFAGARLEFHHPVRVGEEIRRDSRIVDVSHKFGRTGPLVFVKARHEISNGSGVAITEVQDIVYRDNPAPGAQAPPPQKAPEDAEWTQKITPDPLFLFRYSALNFLGHRIHFDRDYATGVEGYPGLLVHGPLLATLLLEILRNNTPVSEVASFSFRAVSPLFDTAPFQVAGRMDGPKSSKLWASSAEGCLAMEATATLV